MSAGLTTLRPTTGNEENELQSLIDRLSPDIIWLGLSTPRQERWMAQHLNTLTARVMIGVGAAFDFHAGLVGQAPAWIRQIGLEWLYRLCLEQKRLWMGYFWNNPMFLWKILWQFFGVCNFPGNSPARPRD